MKETYLAMIEGSGERATRVTIGQLFGLAEVYGVSAIALLVEAGLGELPIDLETAIAVDAELDQPSRMVVLSAVRSARRQTAARRAT